MWGEICHDISRHTGQPFNLTASHSVGGGCINSAYTLTDGRQRFFVKLNQAHQLDMFTAEAEGLQEIDRSRSVRVPRPVCNGVTNQNAYLVMEYIPFGRGKGSDARLGEQLAAMHRKTQPKFGWHRDNTIGSTPQPNPPTDDWPTFFREHRLGFQLQLAARNGFSGKLQKKGERLLGDLDVFFHDYSPAPSLLHGDLWGGNSATDEHGQPVIFDPATYYGDREADIGMTELFGGFSADFYAAYNATWPLDPGYLVRKTLYNLYHIINHVNLFGSGYLGQAEGMLDRLASEIK
jgi:fructosamine-3-kinase